MGKTQPESEFDEFESQNSQKPVSIERRYNLETLNTILNGTNHF